MRLLMFSQDGAPRLGALQGDAVVDLTRAAERAGTLPPPSIMELIMGGDAGLDAVRRLLHTDRAELERIGALRAPTEITFLPPLDPPTGNVVAIGRNYYDHAVESAAAWGQEVSRPTVFTKAQTSVTGPYADIPIDTGLTSRVDWEAELGVVIGRRGKDIPREEALGYVFGYTVVNDISARDIQNGWGGQFFKGKSLDGFCPCGPYLVTADEVPDPQQLRVTCTVDGVLKQDSNTSKMIFPVDEIIAQLSLGMTVRPGTLIATGTPEGVGFARTPPEYLVPGSVVETEVEGIGRLRNRMVEARK